jgi:hypothetical protein
MANTDISTVDLDFNSLKNSFKNYLRSQDQFKDYDLDGPNIGVLLDLLAYNTHKNAFLIHMGISESFLDSARLRSSVLSKAKELNYLPRSARSARANINVSFTSTGDTAPYTIPKGSAFTSFVKNTSYTFTTTEEIVVASANTTYSFDAEIAEGFFVKDIFTYNTAENYKKFKVTNRGVDTNSITVTVYEEGNELGEIYTHATSLLDVTALSKVYFMQPAENGYYEIIFGDNNLGKKPALNSTIVIEYRVTNGKVANGAEIFTIDFDPTGADELTNTPTVTTYNSARSGADAEPINEIKYMAPRHFQTQERAITHIDYEVLLKAQFPEINAVHAYGGEDVNPPQFGKVFIAVDISNVAGFPDSKKEEYYRFIRNRNSFSIIPVFVTPEYTYLRVGSKVRYNINVTSNSKETIRSKIVSAVKLYNASVLNDFDVILRNSQLERAIDDADPSIISSATDIDVYKKINPTLATLQSFTLNFGFEIENNIPEKSDSYSATDVKSVWSSGFRYKGEQCIFEDNGNGTLRVVKTNGTINSKVVDIGTIDYQSGVIRIVDFEVDSYEDSAIKVYVNPVDPDVVAKLNSILTIESSEIDIKLEQIRE